MTDWREARTAPWRPGPVGWVLVLLRGMVIGVVTYGCLILLLVLRLPMVRRWTRRMRLPWRHR